MAVVNIYEAELPWPEGTRIEALRVVQVFPKTTRIANVPNIGIGNQSLGRGVLGTVPVEPDGSAYFEIPPDVPVYFQALDEKGRAVQTMRSVTYAHQGEQLVCHGCHEARRAGPPQASATSPMLAFRRPPSKLAGDVEGSWPLTFPRLVQPVLQDRCVDCHEEESEAPSLSDRPGPHGWSEAYRALSGYAWAKHGGNGWLAKNVSSYSIPGQVGAKASTLLNQLEAGHHEVELSMDEWHRLILWLDLNSNFYGVYHDLTSQARGEHVEPLLQ
jgi:cytochrome c553